MTTNPPPDEFSLIARYFAPLAANFPGALGLKDDAALVDVPAGERLVVTVDAVVAGVHFLPDDPPDLIARKLLRVNLSDIAAMGARPVAVLLAAAFPRDTTRDWLDRFASGLAADCRTYGISLIGGDTVATPGPLTLSVTAIGRVARDCELRRSAAQAGDRIYVSGTIGDAALGLKVLKGELRVPEAAAQHLIDRYRLPQPRVDLGCRLAGLAHAALDISDGLCADLAHICEASAVAAVIEAGRVPLSAAARAALAELPELVGAVLGGGDDYELLFTAPPQVEQRLSELSRTLGLPLTAIGYITDGQGVRVEDHPNGLPRAGGYRHFQGGE